MNGLREVQGYIKSFISEKENIQRQITEIEAQRTQLAEQRNEKKKENNNCETVNQLGKEISELGNQSQELQNQLDFRSRTIKTQVGLIIDNLVAEGIRKIRIANGEIQDLDTRIELQKERNEKYQLQKQEFYLRFGRMPELSERAIVESKLQEKETEKSKLEIKKLKGIIEQIKEEITVLARVKSELKNGNWVAIINIEDVAEEIYIEELVIEEMEPIEEIYVEEFEPIEELYIEEFEPIEEIYVEEFKEDEELETETVQTINEVPVDEIEKLAKSIIEEIVTEQSKDYNVSKVEDIITFEQEVNEKKEKAIIPLFGQRATISNIIIKFEDSNLVYKAKMSDGEEIKIYPKQLGEESVLLRDKQNREECKEILINYAISEHRILDKKVVNKIDPLVCELLIECAERYGHDAQELVYNYAQSFANGELEKNFRNHI